MKRTARKGSIPVTPLFVAVALALAATACADKASDDGSGASASSKQVSREANANAVTAEASEATQSELGVERWEATDNPDGVSVTGYNASDIKVLTMDRRTTNVSATRRVYEYALRAGNEVEPATMTIGLEDQGEGKGILTMLANTFPEKASAVRALELIQQDFAAHEASGSSLTKQNFGGVRPLESTQLTDGKCADLVKCGQTKLVRIDADTKAALVCVGAPLVVGGGVAVDLLGGKDPVAGAAARAGECARAQEHSRNVAEDSAKACRIECVQL